jgi:hypothetical protein
MHARTRRASLDLLSCRKAESKKRFSETRDATPELKNDDLFMQPWFMPSEVCVEMRRLIPSAHLAKMRFYYEDFGCIRCGEHKPTYGSNGFCESCGSLVRSRIDRALKRRLRNVGIKENKDEVLSGLRDSMNSAQDLLSTFRPLRLRRGRRDRQ